MLFGIVIGVTSVMLIYLWLVYQYGFDKFHEKYDQIYRVIIEKSGADNSDGLAEMHADIHPLLLDNVPEIVSCARFKPFDKALVRRREKVFYEDKIAAVDSSFFDIFSFHVLSSGGKKPMTDPFEIYINEKTANRYFGENEPVNQTIRIDSLDVTIGGVFKSWPDNSHLSFDILIPHDLLRRFGITHPWNNYLYVTIDHRVDIDQLSKTIADLATQNNRIISDFHMELGLQALKDIHFTTWLGSEIARTEKKSKLFFFGAIALLIIVFTVLNFTTLLFVDNLKKLKNVAIKKTLGSNRRKLLFEFFTQSIFFIIVAFLLAGSIVELIKPQFVNFTDIDLSGADINFTGIALLFTAFTFAIIVGGLYPNYLLSSLSPSFIMRIDKRFRTRNVSTSNILLIIQFALSFILIICTLIGLQQLQFIQGYELGFNRENIIMIPARKPLVDRFDAIKQELQKIPAIEGITLKSRAFHTGGQDYLRWEGKEENENVIADVFGMEYDFFDVMEMEIVEGRDFSRSIRSDESGGFIINQEAADQIGLEAPVGMGLGANRKEGEIIGVVNNAYFRSLKKDIEPAVFYLYDAFILPWVYNQGSIIIKYKEGKEEVVIQELKKYWNNFNPEQPFGYEFLENKFDALYENDKRTISLFELFSVIAIIISCIGLYAIISYNTEERKKEIGIRKAMGGTQKNITALFSTNILWCLCLSWLVAIPISYIIMDRWLQNFTERLSIPIWTFFAAFIFTGIVSWLTIFFNVRNAAIRNPVDSLRYE